MEEMPIEQNTMINASPIPEAVAPSGHMPPKWMLLLLVVLFIILVTTMVVVFSNAKSPNPQVPSPTKTQQSENSTQVQTAPLPTKPASKSLQEAIDEAKQTASEYNDSQAETLNTYPWIRKLPYATVKYYVYFDLGKKVFVGRLYPEATDDVEQMKSQIKSGLKLKEIPVDLHPFEWSVYPQ